MIEYNNLILKELESFFKIIGEKTFRGKQLFQFIHKNKGTNINEASNFSKDLRDKLNEKGFINTIEIYKKYESKVDETVKYLFKLKDLNMIESVAMKYKHGYSICISTQVGCKMGCVFCASTKDGLVRNLKASEMLEQIYEIEKDLNIEISNIVLMGSGEPLDNFEEVIKFLEIINSKDGRNLSLRNITLSTCGLADEIKKLADYKLPINLAISLHSPFDETRSEIMPVNNRYNLKSVINGVKYYQEKTNRRVTFEYTLISGVNDSIKEGEALVKLLRGLNSHINLIPLNPIVEYNKDKTDNKSLENFSNYLKLQGINNTIRRELGADISASCGQLRRSVGD